MSVTFSQGAASAPALGVALSLSSPELPVREAAPIAPRTRGETLH